MSVIIRLQNLPWSANALDIRNYFRGLSIPEGGVHIVGGELGDAFIAFSTDEDARQAMMLDCGKIKEIQVKLLLSSRSEMHKVIEAARQNVPLLSLASSAPSPAPAAPPAVPATVSIPQPTPPVITPFSSVLGSSAFSTFGIPGLGNPQEIPQPAVIEPPGPLISPSSKTPDDEDKDDDKSDSKRNKDRRRSRSRSRSRDRDRKDRKRDRRDRSRSRERRRRDRSRSRERRDRKRDRKERSRSRERSPRRARDKRNMDRKSPQSSQERTLDKVNDVAQSIAQSFPNPLIQTPNNQQIPMMHPNSMSPNGPAGQTNPVQARFNDPTLSDAFNKLQELGKKRNPNAFQGEPNGNGGRFGVARGGNNNARGSGNFRRDRQSRFDDQSKDCCVAIRNAPNHTSYGDVRRFFPFMIDKHGIKMINDNMGRRTGSIFVRFCDVRSKQLALQKQTNELKGAAVNVESLDDGTYEAAVDSYLPYRDDNDEEDPNLIISDSQDNPRPQLTFSVLKLGDLPNYVKEHDIVKAFSDFSLLSILVNDCRLTRTKVAYVQFVKPDDARKALERRDSYLFGRRQPVITPVADDEYEKEKNEKVETPQVDLLNNEPSKDKIIPRDPRQRRQQNDNGVRPQISQIQGQPAFFSPNGPFSQNFGAPFANPQFSGFPASNVDPRAAAANWANRPEFPKKPEQLQVPLLSNQHIISLDVDDEPLDCVLMKGLPREATDRTILDFLSDTGAVPARIHLMLDGSGHPSGDCFCEFRTPQEARQAVAKHGQHLDGNRVTVDLVMRSVVEEALEGPKADTNGKPTLLGNAPPGPPFFDAPRGGFSGRGPYRGRGGYDRGGYDRGGFDRGSFSRGGFDLNRGSHRGRGSWNERGRGSFDRSRGRGYRGRGGYDGGRDKYDNSRDKFDGGQDQRHDEEDPGLEDFGAPGCVVSMENVPFRATVDDILSFFGDYDLTQDDVIRRYNERGQPTGDARVAFRTPAQAQNAIASRKMDAIFERRISLSLL